jgi:hypothetical protein
LGFFGGPLAKRRAVSEKNPRTKKTLGEGRANDGADKENSENLQQLPEQMPPPGDDIVCRMCTNDATWVKRNKKKNLQHIRTVASFIMIS